MAEKFAEKLKVLNEHGVLLLQRVYNMKLVYSSERKPALLNDKKCKEVLQSLQKNFPTLEYKKIQKIDWMNGRKSEISEQFSYWYGLSNMVLDFKNRATEVLHDVNTKLKGLSLIFHFDIVVNFFELLCTLVSVILLFYRIDERKSIITLYASAYSLLNKGEIQRRYTALAEFMNEFDNPIHGLINLFNPVSTQLGSMLCSLTHLYKRERSTAKLLRNQNKHSLTYKPQDMGVPDVWVAMRFTTRSLNDFTRWICLGFLCVPNEVSMENDTAFQLVKTVLQESWNIQLCFGESLQIHTELEMAARYVKRKELIKLIDDQIPVLNTQVSVFHGYRRQCVRHSLQQLIEVINDQPGLLGPKIAAVLAALSFAKNEMYWYLRHIGHPLKKMKYKDDDWIDPEFPELIYLTEKLLSLLVENEHIVSRYHLEFLVSYDAPKLGYLIQKQESANPQELKLLKSFITRLENVSSQTESENSLDFEGFRMDWFRLQSLIANASKGSALPREQELLRTLNITCFHVSCVDDFHSLLLKATNFKDLFYYKAQIWGMFERALEHPVQVQYVSVFPFVISQYPSTDYESKEQQAVGQSSKKLLNLYLDKMISTVTVWLLEYAKLMVKQEQQLSPLNAGQNYKRITKDGKNQRGTLRKNNAAAAQNKIEKAGHGQGKAEKVPYVEILGELDNITHVESLSKHINLLLTCLNKHPTFSVYDEEFCPVAFLAVNLEECIYKTISELADFDKLAMTIKRPSQLARDVFTFLNIMMGIESFVEIDIPEIFAKAMLRHSDTTDTAGMSLAASYTTWYIDFLGKRMAGNDIIFSKLRKSFVSRASQQVKAEDYADFYELVALCQLLGPAGIERIKYDIMKIIDSEVGHIKTSLRNQKDFLNSLTKNWRDREFKVIEQSKKLKGADDFFARTVHIGLILSFESLLNEALQCVCSQRIPGYFNAINNMNRFFRPIFFEKNGKAQDLDKLLSNAGVAGGAGSLRRFLATHCQQSGSDLETWQSMVSMYSMLMVSLCFNPETVYRPSTEGHENNSHLLATAVNQLTATLIDLSSKGGRSLIFQEQSRFLEMTSLFLLKIRNSVDFQEDKEKRLRNIEGVIVILDKFCNESQYVSSGTLEQYYPYALMRNSYTLLHSRRAKVKKSGMFRQHNKVIEED